VSVTSTGWYTALVLVVAGERLLELVVARRNLAWAMAHGGVESGEGHYPVMVVLHVGLLVGCLLETWWADPPFLPWLGWPMVVVLVAAQGLRWWCIRVLGPRWNTRVVVIPAMPLVDRGPYRWLRHPNYVAVVAEGVALPLVHTNWVTATVFTAANAAVLRRRIRVENVALTDAAV
jgi:methyltransferase